MAVGNFCSKLRRLSSRFGLILLKVLINAL
jgi:hypothetical protein